MSNYSSYQHNSFAEKIVTAICDKVGRKDKEFFRLQVNYYLCVVASMMRTNIRLPTGDIEPVSMYAINLAPSGYGKGYATKIIEDSVINQFRDIFQSTTFPLLAEVNLPAIALKRTHTKQTDYDDELARVEKEFDNLGPMPFSFDSATTPAVKQLRNKLLMANAGSMNLEIDEIGSNLLNNKDVLVLFLELFNGTVKSKLVKNTTDAIRSQDIKGITPTNMMAFGVASSLLDGGKVEEETMAFLNTGYGRRCFFGFVADDVETEEQTMTAADMLAKMKAGTATNDLEDISKHLGTLSEMVKANTVLNVPDQTAMEYFEYQIDCNKRANQFKEHQQLQRTEMKQRHFKAIKVAGAYSFIDGTPEITTSHMQSAIALVEESGNSFAKIHTRDRAYVKFAKYLANVNREVTQADLIEDLPFYSGSKAHREDLTVQAVAWGYAHNIIIKKRYTDSIEFLRGETLESTDLDKLIVSHSPDIAYNYKNVEAPWDQLAQLTQMQDHNWINHYVEDGHRHDDDTQEGFNMIVLDIDNGLTMLQAKSLLSEYKALYYTTKRHTSDNNRFRIVLPTNFKLQLGKDEYKEFMKNLFEWLPFEPDTQTGQRARKWLSNTGHYEYTEGRLLDVLPFIPMTAKNEQRKAGIKDLQSFSNLERWFINNTGDGNRNNQLLNFAYMCVDTGMDYQETQSRVMALNSKLIDKLDESEIMMTIMTTVNKEIQSRAASAA